MKVHGLDIIIIILWLNYNCLVKMSDCEKHKMIITRMDLQLAKDATPSFYMNVHTALQYYDARGQIIIVRTTPVMKDLIQM